MKKNVSGQSIGAEMITSADGSDFTGTVTVLITKDNGTQSSSGGTAPAHEGNGYHSYSPTQAETNADHIAFTFTGSGAITATVQLYTQFPQTVDNNTLIALIPTTAMRGTDGVDTATMRGTDGVDTATMRGTDGANTVTPMTATLSQTEHDATQTAIALIPTTAMRGTDGVDTATMRGTDNALLASSNGSGLTEAGGTGDQLTAIPDVGITQAGADKVWSTTSRTLTDGIQKNQAFNNFEFLMVLTSDHVTPGTGLTVTGQRSIDGGSFGSVTGTIAEVSNGIYQVDFLAADTNGDVITYRFSSATADDTFITITTQ